MNSNFFGKFKAGILKSHGRPSDTFDVNKLETEFHRIAYGPIQKKRLGERTAHCKTVQDFERVSSQALGFPSQATSIWQQLKLSLVNFLTGKQTLSVREKRLKSGEHQWIVYDSRSDTRRVFDSEAAVRSWLEQRYYR